MKIYTKTGDFGQTSLFGGRKVAKSDLRIAAYGTVDELNAYIGLLADQAENQSRQVFLRHIQAHLFTIGTHLAADPEKKISKLPTLKPQVLAQLERHIDKMQDTLPPLKTFILPGGHTCVSFAHLARVVCRRAERKVVLLAETAQLNPEILRYLNRLSDYFFVLARKLSAEIGAAEIPWLPDYTES